MISAIPFTFFLFVFGLLCCKLCMTSCFYVFHGAWFCKLGGTFFIAQLKWAPFDCFSLQHLMEVMLFEKAPNVGKEAKFSCKFLLFKDSESC